MLLILVLNNTDTQILLIREVDFVASFLPVLTASSNIWLGIVTIC